MREIDFVSQAEWDVVEERQRQRTDEGWTSEHDDEHNNHELAHAAVSYAAYEGPVPPSLWPWDAKWWKPTDRRRSLVKAAALLVAEIERIDRAQSKDDNGDDTS